MKNKTIVNNLKITYIKSVAVYKIIRNNEIQCELAYPDNKNGYNIIIYNIIIKLQIQLIKHIKMIYIESNIIMIL